MKFAEITEALRDTSARFGGIGDYDNAARELDSALSQFFIDQDEDSLRAVNGAYARCMRFRKQVSPMTKAE